MKSSSETALGNIRAAVARRFAPGYRLSELLGGREWPHRFAAALGRSGDGERLARSLLAEESLTCRAVRAAWTEHLREYPRARLHFYIHIPFCPQKCAHCAVYTVSGGGDMEAYLDRLEDALGFYSGTFVGKTFDTLYIGGGTPSRLDAPRLERLLGRIFKSYSFVDSGQKTFKFNADGVDASRLTVLKRHGINRVTLETQTLNEEARRLENSGTLDRATLEKAFFDIRAAGGFSLNVDVLLGMRGDGKEDFLRSLDAVLELRPDDLGIYPIQPAARYLNAFYDGSAADFGARVAEVYPGLPEEVLALAQGRGFRPKQDLRLEDAEWLFRCRDSDVVITTAYADQPEGRESVFGLGTSARSRISGRLAYQERQAKDERFDPELPIYRGERLPLLCEERRFVLMSLRNRGAVPLEDFERTFGKSLESVFPEALTGLRTEGRSFETEGRLTFRAKSARERFEDALRFMDLRGAFRELFDLEIDKQREGI